MHLEPKKAGWRQATAIQYLRENSGILIALLVLCVIFTINSPAFLTRVNMINVLRQISMNAIVAFGMTLVILLGGIDLSVGSIIAVSGCSSVILIVNGCPLWLGVLVGLAVGALFGFITGTIVAMAKLPPFIVTLAMMTIGRGIAYIFTGGKPTRFDAEAFNQIGNGYVGIIPIPVIIMLVTMVLCSVLLNKTMFGRHVYGVGGNRQAAKFSGIKIAKVEIAVYTICGLLAAVSGIIMASRLSGAQPTAGDGQELDAIAAVVLGGTSMSGGVGRIGGTIIGALIIGVLNNGMNLMHLSYYWQLVVKGLIILFAVYVDALKKDKTLERLFKKKRA
ncbi:ribose ABC transporter permease [Intestinibacillus massiliensis]|uniref:ABC transporter permease n=1 Tax=Intestinibacillus massiliensis TaxID=1871029 RepID=UPI000B34E228|nr:ribose ABC transporter permease [Intestinibacillus massiliensis]MCB6365412.1 ribose ABC transporter permease [Intestinibacillus massiliensis]